MRNTITVHFMVGGKGFTIFNSENPDLKAAIAENCTDAEALQILASDENEQVQLAVAKNPNINGYTVKQLLSSPFSSVQDIVQEQYQNAKS